LSKKIEQADTLPYIKVASHTIDQERDPREIHFTSEIDEQEFLALVSINFSQRKRVIHSMKIYYYTTFFRESQDVLVVNANKTIIDLVLTTLNRFPLSYIFIYYNITNKVQLNLFKI